MTQLVAMLETGDFWRQLWNAFLSIGLFGALGLIWQAFNWLRERRKEAKEAAEAAEQEKIEANNDAYRSLNDSYFDFLRSVLAYPNLGVLPWMPASSHLSETDLARRGILFEMVTALCEQAWVLRNRTDEIAANQWPGWEGFIITLLEHPAYREHLDLDRLDGRYGGYDSRYEAYLTNLIASRNLGSFSTASSAIPIPQ
ncbi:hypothetical protein [Rhizobium leguminosarum]|uniref:hypothetical protein n=1 Tax=Rhizobium leguminosarum TaxID=384 RepID=UPI001030FB99|nr:hypothetical protein [Rhizobium leguminosarum]TAW50611.1 hypothetical protein ELI14_04140 [Rhizobium leguminosarum]